MKMKDINILLYSFIILYININKSFAAPSPSPDSSFVFPGPSTSDNFNPSSRSFTDDYHPVSYNYEDNFENRHLNYHKRKHYRPYLSSGHGCRGHRCDYEGYGERPNYNNYYSKNGQSGGGTFATATAGNRQPNYFGSDNSAITSQSNAQSATFNFGPFSASFSTALAISGPKGFQNR